MKVFVCAVALMIGVVLSAGTSAATDSRVRLDGVAAVVGDEPILLSELEAYMLMRLNTLQPQKDSATNAALRKEFLDELVDGKVLLVHAKKDTTISVKSEDVDAALNQHIQRLMAENHLSQEAFEQELAKQGLSPAKARAQWRRGIQEQMLKQKAQQAQMGSFEVSQRDVQDFYQRYKDSLPELGESVRLLRLTIDVPTSDSVRQAAYDKIMKVRQRLDNGESFEALAKQFSEDPSAASGGDLGFIAKGTLREIIFEEKAFALKPGEVSEPFQTRMGFHIVKVDEKKEQMVHVRQILVAVAPTRASLTAARNTIDSIAAACTTSAAFVAAVKTYSTDRPSKAHNGDLGWQLVSDLPETYRAAFDTLHAGLVSKPIVSDNSFTLLFVDKMVAKRPLTVEDDYTLLAEKARDIYAQKKLAALVRKWRQAVFIDIRL